MNADELRKLAAETQKEKAAALAREADRQAQLSQTVSEQWSLKWAQEREANEIALQALLSALPNRLQAAAAKGETSLLVVEDEHWINERYTSKYFLGMLTGDRPKSANEISEELDKGATSVNRVSRITDFCRARRITVNVEIVRYACRGGRGVAGVPPAGPEAGIFRIWACW